MIRFKTIVRLLLAVFAITASAHADVIYSFSGSVDWQAAGLQPPATLPSLMAFQLTVPDFISTPSDGSFDMFSCSQLDSSTNCNSLGVGFGNLPDPLGGIYGSEIAFYVTSSTASGVGTFFFPTGTFTTPGVYLEDPAIIGDLTGTLTITKTPEPASIFLVSSAMLLLFILIALRRRLLA